MLDICQTETALHAHRAAWWLDMAANPDEFIRALASHPAPTSAVVEHVFCAMLEANEEDLFRFRGTALLVYPMLPHSTQQRLINCRRDGHRQFWQGVCAEVAITV